jgi:SWI/SNF-related matrix-associated actin-dependent regulator of chromatin subfamily A member 5
MARCHRIGQTKPVTVYRLITQNTVEEQSLSRLAKKLYLSVKVTTAATQPNSQNTTKKDDDGAPNFTKGELVKLLRSGAKALTDPTTDTWEDKRIEEIIRESRERQQKMEETVVMTEEELESAEKELLNDAERIRTMLFEGKMLARQSKEITDDWKNLTTKRIRNERTVLVDGFKVNKESLQCRDWEAFPTFSANFVPPPKRQRRQFEHQDYCQYCREGGEVVMCSGCPRVIHAECAGYTPAEVAKMSWWFCPQHNCSICERNTSQAGNMLFRCQTCADSFWSEPLTPLPSFLS